MMLNLLIAMFGNTYSLVRYVSEQEWLMEWANLIMRFQRGIGKKKVKIIRKTRPLQTPSTNRAPKKL